jgi:hypothetical protein
VCDLGSTHEIRDLRLNHRDDIEIPLLLRDELPKSMLRWHYPEHLFDVYVNFKEVRHMPDGILKQALTANNPLKKQEYMHGLKKKLEEWITVNTDNPFVTFIDFDKLSLTELLILERYMDFETQTNRSLELEYQLEEDAFKYVPPYINRAVYRFDDPELDEAVNQILEKTFIFIGNTNIKG